MQETPVIRTYKDTVFRRLFSDTRALLSLYNALNGTHYENPEELEIYTLDNAIYMNVKNDVSFLLHSQLSLYEQQATVNPNMPLRDLDYISHQLRKYARKETIYSSKLVKIPVPRFVVFYNGSQKQPERQILKLSDAFEQKTEDPSLELKVLMLNITPGNNQELLEKCRTLKEYCLFVEHIRKYATDLPIEKAVDRAVTECIHEGILAEFLSAQRAEVVSMSIFEFNEEEEMKKIRAAEYQVGVDDGIAQGMARGRAEDILELLTAKGDVDSQLQDKILQETDLKRLSVWHKAAIAATSVEAFVGSMQI